MIEEDDLRGEVRENLERMCEGLRMLDGDDDENSEGAESKEEDDY